MVRALIVALSLAVPLAGLTAPAATAAEEDRLVLSDGRVLVGEYLGQDASLVRFATGSAVQEVPQRMVQEVRLHVVGQDAPATRRPVATSNPSMDEVDQRLAAGNRGSARCAPPREECHPVCHEPVRCSPPPCTPAPYWRYPAYSGLSFTYGVGSGWGYHRPHGGWGLNYAVTVPLVGWGAPSPWCR